MNFGVSIKSFEGMFFDRALVEGKIDRATHAVMSRFGAFVRRTARQNFRRGSAKKPVPPNPRNIKGFMRDGKYGIQFRWLPFERLVIVGPQLMPRTRDRIHPATEKVERGGTFPVNRKSKKGGRRTYTATYREFPFMRNALATERPNLPTLWRDTIR